MPAEKSAENKKTVSIMKEKRTVPKTVLERTKHYVKIKKTILDIFKQGPKTIPEVARESKLPIDETMYYVMSLQKFGHLAVGEVDDNDEFYYYSLK